MHITMKMGSSAKFHVCFMFGFLEIDISGIIWNKLHS